VWLPIPLLARSLFAPQYSIKLTAQCRLPSGHAFLLLPPGPRPQALAGVRQAGRALGAAAGLLARRALSWDTNNPENLFKLTSQALIHDISLHQMETVKTVVPWFLTNMPVSAYVLRLFL
jgi:hypothetical protein